MNATIASYYGHPVVVVRRGRKNTRIRFESGRTKVVANECLRIAVVAVS